MGDTQESHMSFKAPCYGLYLGGEEVIVGNVYNGQGAGHIPGKLPHVAGVLQPQLHLEPSLRSTVVQNDDISTKLIRRLDWLQHP